jgi:PiT family inorganic phosphate transporter
VTSQPFLEGATGAYLQGASAEVVAACTIGLAAMSGMPVSTKHVLSSGVAVALAGLQDHTLYKIAAAWVLTKPAGMFLSGALFVAFSQWMA